MRTVAALYIDPLGPYPSMPGVDAWDESRDARRYDGPHPVVAHPPCGPWGSFANRCVNQSRELAIHGSFARSGHAGPRLISASKEIRRRTPLEFAELLVGLARAARDTEAA